MTRLAKKFWRLLPFIGVGVSLLMLVHSLWQLDLICASPVWQTEDWIQWFQKTGYTNYCDMPFQCGFLFRTTVGNAYDYFLSVAVASWFVLAVSMWFWHKRTLKELKKRIEKEGG